MKFETNYNFTDFHEKQLNFRLFELKVTSLQVVYIKNTFTL